LNALEYKDSCKEYILPDIAGFLLFTNKLEIQCVPVVEAVARQQ